MLPEDREDSPIVLQLRLVGRAVDIELRDVDRQTGRGERIEIRDVRRQRNIRARGERMSLHTNRIDQMLRLQQLDDVLVALRAVRSFVMS